MPRPGSMMDQIATSLGRCVRLLRLGSNVSMLARDYLHSCEEEVLRNRKNSDVWDSYHGCNSGPVGCY